MCVIFVILLLIDLAIPDPLPFVDEILLLMASLGACNQQEQ
jgi:hypothetical protein